jgi:transposase-like protein
LTKLSQGPSVSSGPKVGAVLGNDIPGVASAPRKYSEELPQRAVRLVFESGRPVAHVALDAGVHKEVLHSWVRWAEARHGPAAVTC